LCVGDDSRVVVDVDDVGAGGEPADGLVVWGKPASNVDELIDPLVGQVPDDSLCEHLRSEGHVREPGELEDELVSGRAVDLVVVLAALQVVPHPCRVRLLSVDGGVPVIEEVWGSSGGSFQFGSGGKGPGRG